MKTTIKKWGINGEGIAYVNRKPVFIENVIPDEVVEMEIKKEEEKYSIGELTRIIEESPKRRFALCPIWKECGGCALMHVKYPAQCKMKESVLKEALQKYANYKGRVLPIIKNPEPLAYRNSCKLPLGIEYDELYCGMYQRDSNDFVKMERCFVHSKILEQTRQEVMKVLNKHHARGLTNLVMKEFGGKVQVILVGNLEDSYIEDIMNLENVCSLWHSEKTDQPRELFGDMRLLAGDEKMIVDLNEIKLSLLPRSFFQLNTKQASHLYHIVKDWMPVSKCIVEAYSGVGAMSLLLKDKADKVIGIESIQDAVDNANENAQFNDCKNVSFICGDAANQLKEIIQTEDVDGLVVDPPRSGLNDEMKDVILHSKIKHIIYVSCNPSTLGKDLAVLQKKYRIVQVQPVDMFSQTPHVETIVLLEEDRKKDHSSKPRRRFNENCNNHSNKSRSYKEKDASRKFNGNPKHKDDKIRSSRPRKSNGGYKKPRG